MNSEPCVAQELARASDSEPMLEYETSGPVVLAGQPQPLDWAELVNRGFDTIINVRSDPEKAAAQAVRARAAGLEYVHLPLPVYELEPEHLAAFHEVFKRAGRGKILLHCRTASRTALLWLLHQVVYAGRTPAEAEAELWTAGYDEDSMNTFRYCAQDFFERAGTPAPVVPG